MGLGTHVAGGPRGSVYLWTEGSEAEFASSLVLASVIGWHREPFTGMRRAPESQGLLAWHLGLALIPLWAKIFSLLKVNSGP